MELNKKILSIKSIKIGFDVVFFLLVILLALFFIASIIDISYLNTSKGHIGSKVEIERTVDNNNIDVFSRINNSKVSSKISSYEIVLNLQDSDSKVMVLIYQIVNFLTLTLGLLLIIFIVFHIRKILKSIVKGIKRNNNTELMHHIFNNSNIRRFRYIGISFIIVPFIDLFLLMFHSYFISKYFYVKDIGVDLKPVTELSIISWDYIFIGLLFLALIEVIRKGMIIQEENDLTV